MKKISAVLWALSIFTCAACAPLPVASGVHTILLVSPDGEQTEIRAEIAADDAAREQGLMGRTALADGEGMLFVFEEEKPLSFWMKNTLLPLDIAFFDDEGQFVSSATMQPCLSDPCPTHPSAAPAAFALEVPAGFLSRARVGPGWSLRQQ